MYTMTDYRDLSRHCAFLDSPQQRLGGAPPTDDRLRDVGHLPETANRGLRSKHLGKADSLYQKYDRRIRV